MTATVIIFEGPDFAGKSTAVARLREKAVGRGLDVEVLHRGPPKRHPLGEYELEIQALEEWKDLIICDRWHWGELIYGPLYRGESLLAGAGFQHVEMFLESRHVQLVLLSPATSVLEARSTRGDDYIKLEHLPFINAEYRRLFEVSRLTNKVLTSGVSETYLDQLVNKTWMKVHTTAPEDRYGLSTAHTYIGPDEPAFILVGDQRSDTHHGHHAAFTPYPNTSGEFLFKAINSAAITARAALWPEYTGMLNAEPDLPALLEHLQACKEDGKPVPTVLALGRAADKALTDEKVRHGTVPHPQFVRRFHKDLLTDYGKLIFDTLRDREDHGSWPKS